VWANDAATDDDGVALPESETLAVAVNVDFVGVAVAVDVDVDAPVVDVVSLEVGVAATGAVPAAVVATVVDDVRLIGVGVLVPERRASTRFRAASCASVLLLSASLNTLATGASPDDAEVVGSGLLTVDFVELVTARVSAVVTGSWECRA
jgi:hypothetical protein